MMILIGSTHFLETGPLVYVGAGTGDGVGSGLEGVEHLRPTSHQETVQNPTSKPVSLSFPARCSFRVLTTWGIVDPCGLPTAFVHLLFSSSSSSASSSLSQLGVFLARIDHSTTLKSPSCFPK